MTKDNEKSSEHYLWTGAMSVPTDEPGQIAGLLGEVSPLSGPGVVQLSFHRATCPPEEHEGHVNFYISEATARRLIEQLTKVVHRAEAMRVLHRQGVLREESLVHRDDLPWQFLGARNDPGDEGSA